MSALSPSLARPVLADVVSRTTAMNVVLVAAAVAITALSAQVRIATGLSPVPFTGQTFAVLLTAAALGPARALAAQGGYLLLGLAGLPFFTGGESGWTYATGATGGYLVGFLVAATVVGWLARRGLDRTPWGTVAAFAIGSLVIYAFGVPWLAISAQLPFATALHSGATLFLISDAMKALLAAALLPGAWAIVRRAERR